MAVHGNSRCCVQIWWNDSYDERIYLSYLLPKTAKNSADIEKYGTAFLVLASSFF